MYGAEQGREKRDVSWTAQASEWGLPSSMAMKRAQRQPWGDGKCLEDRSVPSPWALLPLGRPSDGPSQEELSAWAAVSEVLGTGSGLPRAGGT